MAKALDKGETPGAIRLQARFLPGRKVKQQFNRAGQLQEVAGVEIDEQQAGAHSIGERGGAVSDEDET